MDKEIVWTDIAKTDLKNIFSYLQINWPSKVVNDFNSVLNFKVQLLSRHPHIGFKSKKYSRFRKTLITKNYIIIYSIKKEHIVILRIKHIAMK
ncbi:MAG: type II toxin-antitoxin system RelE/ParE family toxin [Ginsengibacter sp.]